jgi:hypothetical protein
MKQIKNLTELETKVLNAVAGGMYAEWGYSDYGFAELSEELELSTKVLRGVVGSLVKKDLVRVEDDNQYDIIYLWNEAQGLVKHWVEENPELEAAEII